MHSLLRTPLKTGILGVQATRLTRMVCDMMIVMYTKGCGVPRHFISMASEVFDGSAVDDISTLVAETT